ncbi:MAG: UDP-4-amino-4,6-dideoxy-N-acetyl-beta-L-altrosamine transaminase [Patescibacteria group bacterium]
MQKPTFIPYGRHYINKEDISAVLRILKSDYLTQGPKIAEFEQRLATICDVQYAVAFSSGTAALHAACFAAKIKHGDEIVTTPMTFAASANCVLYCKGTPVFADIKSDLPLINPDEIARKITSKTRVIIPVDYSGIPADYDEINKIAKDNNLLVIADAAHSLGATYKGKKVGQLADMTVLSFHPVKLITTGEGGMVLTNERKFYERLELFRSHGITKNKKILIQKDIGPWYYEMQDLGYNYRLSEFQAALGISQSQRMEIYVKQRNEIARKYKKAFISEPRLKTLDIPLDRTSAWHLFPILLNGVALNKKKQIVEEFHRLRIMVQVHYIPVHLHPYYKQKLSFKEGDFPNAEKFYTQEISLPLFPQLTDKEIQRVVDITRKLIMKYS